VTGQLHVSVLGAILASGFAVAMVALLVWMLRLPRPVPLEVARAVRSVGAVQTILVPILEEYYSERAVELGCRLGQTQKATILLGYVVEVPRTLSLGVPLPEVEEPGRRALEQARTIVEMHGLQAQTQIIRAREAGEGIARVARDNNVDVIVLGISPESGFIEGAAARLAESLFRHAPCEVIIDRLAETSIGADASREATPPPAAEESVPSRQSRSSRSGRTRHTSSAEQEAPRRPV
jgi:nucleotide-binding universal stress UspA family protein